MPRIPQLAGCVAAAALLALTACGSAGTSTTSTTSTSAGTRPAVVPEATTTQPNCPDPGWAYKFTDAGAVAWHVSLPNTPDLHNDPQPVAVGGVSVFGHGNAIYGLRLSDGHQEWRRVFATTAGSLAGAVDDLWTWDGSVIALVGPYGLVSAHGAGADRLVSLNPATGAVRWTVNLGSGDPVYGTLARTSNGVLAMVRQGGRLQGVSLTAGKLLWSRAYAHQEDSDGPVASGTVVAAAVKGTVSGFDASTGRLLWRHAGVPSQADVMAAPGGRVVVYDLLQQVPPPRNLFPVTALSAATGRVVWRVATAGPVSVISAEQGWLAVGTSGKGISRLDLVNPATGRVRLSVTTYVASDMTWVLTPTDLVYFMSNSLYGATQPGVTEVVDRRLATGTVRWSVRLPLWSAGALVRPSGPDVLVTSFAGGPAELLAIDVATGHARAVTGLPQIPPAPVVTGGDALLALYSPPCAFAYAATGPLGA